MPTPEFDIVLSPGGQVKVTITGVQGPRCLEYAELIREIVGREEQRELTADYYAASGQVRIDAHAQTRVQPPPT